MTKVNNFSQKQNVQVFQNSDFGKIRTVQVENEPYFVGRDVAKALGYSKPENAIAQHVDNEDTLKQGIPDNQGVTQNTTIINESGVYSLIFGSKLPQAKLFKNWVTSEVLPSIRKTGGYISINEQDTPELIMAKALQVAKQTIENNIFQKHFGSSKNYHTFAVEHYNINSWAKNRTNFLNKIKRNPLWWRLGNCPQPQTPSVCCDVHTYGGFLHLSQF